MTRISFMIEYYMRAVCDKCKQEIEPTTKVLPSKIIGLKCTWKHEWKKRGVMVGLPSRFGKFRLYCEKCAGS